MAEEATDVQAPEITLEDFNADEQESPKAESSPAEDKKPDKAEAKEPEVEAKGDDTPAEAEEPEAKETDTESPEAEETETKPQGEKPPAPKSENRYQNLANENRELRRQVEGLTAQAYQPATEDDLTNEVNPDTGEPYTKIEAKFEAYRQGQEVEKYTERVYNAQNQLSAESFQVMQDFPIFNPSSEDFDSELASEAATLLEANLIRDPNVPEIGQDGQPTGKGLVIGSNVSPHQLYKTLARAADIRETKGQLKGQQSTERMLANADTNSSAAPAKKPSDPLMDLWKADD